MPKYKFKIEADSVDISAAVLAGFSITNGRSDFTQGFVQWSANLSVYKKDLQSILTTAGKDSDSVAPGAEIIISVETAPSTWLKMFRGLIVGTSADAYKYKFECVDEIYFGFLQSEPRDVYDYTALDNYIAGISSDPASPFRFEGSSSSTFPNYVPAPAIRSDFTAIFNEAASVALYTFLELLLPDERTALGNQIKIGQLKETDLSTADFSITDSMVQLNFDTKRQANEIYNTIIVNYDSITPGGGESVEAIDQTSVNKFGKKILTINSNFRNPISGASPNADVAARQLAEALLQQYNLWGFSLISFRTSADLLGLTVENTVKKVFPRKVIDSSAMTPPEFQQKMVVQQVEHRCSPDYWEINVLAANYRFVSASQPWSEVTSNLKWSDVPSYLTWDMIRTKDL
jgi:hypothetical protein